MPLKYVGSAPFQTPPAAMRTPLSTSLRRGSLRLNLTKLGREEIANGRRKGPGKVLCRTQLG
jgi:hypothetical protein